MAETESHRNAGGEAHDTSSLLELILKLTDGEARSDSAAEIFQGLFRQLSSGLAFDVAVGVVLEQTLDVYISRCTDCQGFSDTLLIESIRKTLESEISIPFESTDIVIRTDHEDLPARGDVGDSLRFQTLSALKLNGRKTGLVLLFRGDGEFEGTDQPILGVLANHVAILLEKLRTKSQMQNLADTDDLTGIWNRRYFRRHLPGEVDRSRIYSVPMSLLVLDLDDFKQINDRHGHSMGDVLLSEVCGTIRDSLRPPDLFARIGGDEFAVILPHTDAEGAKAVADRIVRRVGALEIFAGEESQPVRTSLSVGVATLAERDESSAEILDRADQQLYRSKRSGKGRYSS
ncbi:MAG TPA: GGDEF domain-containing protein [Thermoanaerobaculia bacterium]|nr:GGDEF domain-containing protein [Thermoanaerobaculia bacterium]